MNGLVNNKARNKELKNLLIAFLATFFITVSITIFVEYRAILAGNGGNVPVIIAMLIIIITTLLLTTFFKYFENTKLPTWLMVSIILILFTIWVIGFDIFALLIIPILIEILILFHDDSLPSTFAAS